MYAILIRENYELFDVYETYQDAFDVMSRIREREPEIVIDVADTRHASHLKVEYTELGGPSGYGHQEVSFETYGGIVPCVIRFYNWIKHTERVFGPDWRDIRDYFSHCSLSINGQDKTKWFLSNYVDKIPHELFV